MIVGLGHVAQVGKDTAAEGLVRDLRFTRVGFADSLKELALELDPIVSGSLGAQNVNVGHGKLAHAVAGLGWEEAKNVYPEVRGILQRLGVGARTVFGDDFWINQVLDGLDDTKNYVVSDVRFRNEAEAIADMGGRLIRVDRPGRAGQGHQSETELLAFEGWDAVVTNHGTVDDLQNEVIAHVKGWMSDESK